MVAILNPQGAPTGSRTVYQQQRRQTLEQRRRDQAHQRAVRGSTWSAWFASRQTGFMCDNMIGLFVGTAQSS